MSASSDAVARRQAPGVRAGGRSAWPLSRIPRLLCSQLRSRSGRPGAAGLSAAPSGIVYALIFIGRSGEAFPSGVEIHAIVPALEPLDEAQVDRDLWSILRWMVEGVGGEWTVEAWKRPDVCSAYRPAWTRMARAPSIDATSAKEASMSERHRSAWNARAISASSPSTIRR